MNALAPRGAQLERTAARHLGRMPRIIASAQDLEEVLHRLAELVAEAIRADAASIRLGGAGGTEVLHVRRPWGEPSASALPTRLTVPLVLRGRRLGMLTALRARRRPFPQTATALLGAFAGPIAMAVDNARLFDALQDRLADVVRLGEASEAIAALGDIGAVGAQLARQAAHLVSAERGVLLLLDADRAELVAQAPAYGVRPAQVRKLRFPLAEGGESARVLESGRPYIANDIPGDRRDVGRRAFGERSVLMVPLRAAAHPVGVLTVSNKRQGLFTRQDARLLAVFAAQAAVALENAMLYQEAVREREQLKELERLKSQFLSLVSHELRTPVTSIKASAEVLLSTAPAGIPEAHLRLLRNIDRSSDRLSALITDLLDLIRLESGRLELQREYLDVRQVAEEAVSTVRPLADRRNQTIQIDLSADTCPVYGDRRRLEQIALNLLMNGVKFAPLGGTIWLQVRRDADRHVRLTVRDEGPGIPAEEQRRVFEPFYRLDTEETRRTTGTGLGLPIASALTELHGGSLHLESAPGQGSTFSMTLPGATCKS
ncbi:MAG: GAF domain-containing protein [Chloroflexi bacterium]|nr:GAF domain-containing protein [Chloroflexota bacterium]